MTDYTQIVKASRAVGSLQPDKKNLQQKYDYISADKILERAGQALVEAGLALVPEIIDAQVETVEYTDSYGKAKTRYDARLGMTMHICGNGGAFAVGWFGYGVDYASPDKAVAKAITTAHKYFLMKLLNIGIGNEDGEHESQPVAEADARRQPADARGETSPQAQARRKRPAAPKAPVLKENGNGADPLQAARASLKGRASTLSDIATAAVMSGLYDNTLHAFNAVKLYGWPESDKFELVSEQKVKTATARAVLDWLISRKLDEADAAETKEVTP